jgi:hypothetical protein
MFRRLLYTYSKFDEDVNPLLTLTGSAARRVKESMAELLVRWYHPPRFRSSSDTVGRSVGRKTVVDRCTP